MDLGLHQTDVKTTFLNEDLKDEVYIRQPKGFDDNSQKSCKLRKSMYGLRQVSHWVYIKFYKVITSYGFIESLVN